MYVCEWSGRLTAFTAVVAPASLAPDETPVVPKDATKLSELVVVTPQANIPEPVVVPNATNPAPYGILFLNSGILNVAAPSPTP